MSQVQVEYSLPPGDGSERIARAWARVPLVPTPAQRAAQKARTAALLRARDAVLVAHNVQWWEGLVEGFAGDNAGRRWVIAVHPMTRSPRAVADAVLDAFAEGS